MGLKRMMMGTTTMRPRTKKARPMREAVRVRVARRRKMAVEMRRVRRGR